MDRSAEYTSGEEVRRTRGLDEPLNDRRLANLPSAANSDDSSRLSLDDRLKVVSENRQDRPAPEKTIRLITHAMNHTPHAC